MTELARSQLRPLSPSLLSSGLQSAASWTPKASASPRDGISGSMSALTDLPNGGVRASLLVRMWKEVESEAAMKAQESCIHSPRVQCVDPAVNCPVKKVFTNTHDETPSPLPLPPPEREPPSVIEVPHDEYNSSAESPETMKDQASDTGQCGGRVADIVRKLSLVAQSENGATFAASPSATPTAAAEHKRNEAAALLNEVSSPATTKLQDENMQQRNETRCSPDEIKIERYAFNRNNPRVRGRMATMDVLVRMKHERQRELAALEENRPVSEFSQRSRIHAFLKFKCLRNGGTSRNQGTHALGTPKLHELRLETAIPPLRSVSSGFSSIPDSPTNSVPAYENRFAQASDLAEPLSLAASSASFMTTTTVEEGAGSVTGGGRGILLAKQSSFSDRGHPHEESEENSDVLLEEDRSSVAENAEWDGCTGIATPEGWQGGASPDHHGVPASGLPHDEDEPLESGRWMDFLSAGSQRPWESCKRSVRYDWYDSTSDNPELEQLLKRKSVSTSLASGFRKKMDQLIMSHIEKQEQLVESEYLDTKEEDLKPLQQKNNVGARADHAAATSRSEMPSLAQALGEQVDDNHLMVFADNYPQPSDASGEWKKCQLATNKFLIAEGSAASAAVFRLTPYCIVSYQMMHRDAPGL
ncbi:hypothetical protein EJ110_NYTH09301 [Nymphaea thermarum]|nr:hypothetical protein EJ110_NYTH09301 [Nymphaea thermarum]